MNRVEAQHSKSFASKIRRVSGGLSINFFAGMSDTAARIDERTSTTHRVIEQEQSRQIFHPETEIESITSFDASWGMPIKGIPLNGTARLVGSASSTGWVGNATSGNNGDFESPQIISVDYLVPRLLPQLLVRGLDSNNYPTNFDIRLFDQGDNTIRVVRVRRAEDAADFGARPRDKYGNELPTTDVIRVESFEQRFEFNLDRLVKSMRLDIKKWNRAGALPRIRVLVGEMHEGFDGSSLQRIETVEEKTGALDRLSYSISSNYCQAVFANRDRKFYQPRYFDMLKSNRSVVPFVRCADALSLSAGHSQHNPEKSEQYLLGQYYSQDWQLEDDSAFMSVRANDILYSLQSVNIDYGMREVTDSTGQRTFVAQRNVRLEDAVSRIFALTESVRRSNGLFDRVEAHFAEDSIKNILIPYLIVPKGSVWDILQDIARLCCLHIYSDRSGRIVFKSDGVENGIGSSSVTRANESVVRRYEMVKRELSVSDSDSIATNGLHEYAYDAKLYASTEHIPQVLQDMANEILNKYSNGVGYVECEWWGDASLQLGDKFLAQSMHEDERKCYEVLSVATSKDDKGFRQVVRGRELDQTGQTAPRYTIDCSNAFSFGIPVKSRMMVNSVKMEYYHLVESEDEAIKVDRYSCNEEAIDGTTARYEAEIELPRVYDRIAGVRVHDLITVNRDTTRVLLGGVGIVSVGARSMRIHFVARNNFEEVEVSIMS